MSKSMHVPFNTARLNYYIRTSLLLIVLILMQFKAVCQTLDIPLITLTESSVAYAPVDEIHFTIDINTHAKQVAEARNKNKVISKSVFTYLKEMGVSDRYIQTKRMIVSKNYHRNHRDRTYDGFNAHQHVYVCLKNLDIFDEVLDSLLVMDVGTVNGPILKSSSYDSVMKKAKIEAVKKARVSAEELAAALGQEIGKAKLINSTVQYNSGNVAYSGADQSRSSQTSSTSFQIGEIEINATVEVSFELLD